MVIGFHHLWLLGALHLGHNATNFGDFRHCGSGDKVFLICLVILKDHVFKGLCDLMGGVPS